MTDLPKKALLTVPEVADFFRVQPRCIYQWVSDGKLIAEQYYNNGPLRIPRESVLDLRERSRVDPEAKYSL
jgi:hypothetical protein